MSRIFILFIALAFSSCSATQSLQSLSSLTSNKWVLNALGGNTNLTSMFGDQLPFLNFSADGTLSGNDGCNNLTGNVGSDFLKTDQLDLSGLASTKMACATSGPDKFASMLGDAKSFDVKDNVLNLLGADGTSLAQFIPGN